MADERSMGWITDDDGQWSGHRLRRRLQAGVEGMLEACTSVCRGAGGLKGSRDDTGRAGSKHNGRLSGRCNRAMSVFDEAGQPVPAAGGPKERQCRAESVMIAESGTEVRSQRWELQCRQAPQAQTGTPCRVRASPYVTATRNRGFSIFKFENAPARF